jgi:hypothetical protein
MEDIREQFAEDDLRHHTIRIRNMLTAIFHNNDSPNRRFLT